MKETKESSQIEDQILNVKRGQAFKDINKSAKQLLRQNYYDIKDILQKYIVMDEDYYPIVSLWIIGTYLHNQFKTFPYLFFNATRGSGKSRILNLITTLAKDGKVMASPTEAVLFRTIGTLGIDEFERVASKDKSSIRELLNASYKKGIKICRMKKKKTLDGEQQIVEEFEPYRPIVIANIWGMEEVLGDRCIKLILEKSNDELRTKLTEAFDEDETIQKVLKRFEVCSLCSVVSIKNIYKQWNNYIIDKYKTTLTTYNTYNTQTTQTTSQLLNQVKIDSFFNKVDKSGLNGRNLELFLPIFLIAMILDEGLLNDVIKIAKDLNEEKAKEDEIESMDVLVIEFISVIDVSGFCSIKELKDKFRDYTGETDEWVNSKWFGRALKRLNLISEKRRTYRGIEVILNKEKAKEKLRMFKK